jgi:hypothetical protein
MASPAGSRGGIERDDVHGDGCVREVLELEVTADEVTQPAMRDEVIVTAA